MLTAGVSPALFGFLPRLAPTEGFSFADFGAFVDIGVHQDGLVHRSEMAESHVRDPQSCVKAGQAVQVMVLQVDPGRHRIALTMKGLSRPLPKEEKT